MMYLWPQASSMLDFHHGFGVMTSPAHKSVPLGIKEGRKWAIDNEVYTRGFDPDRMEDALARLRPYIDTCLFVTVPDVVGDAAATIESWWRWCDDPLFRHWPLAFAAQDGIKVGDDCLYTGSDEDFTDWVMDKDINPEDDVACWEAQKEWRQQVGFFAFDWLFVGGTTEWKMGPALEIIKAAQKHDRPVHVGRVNSTKRMKFFQQAKVDSVDGTKAAYEPKVAYRRFLRVLAQPRLF